MRPSPARSAVEGWDLRACSFRTHNAIAIICVPIAESSPEAGAAECAAPRVVVLPQPLISFWTGGEEMRLCVNRA